MLYLGDKNSFRPGQSTSPNSTMFTMFTPPNLEQLRKLAGWKNIKSSSMTNDKMLEWSEITISYHDWQVDAFLYVSSTVSSHTKSTAPRLVQCPAVWDISKSFSLTGISCFLVLLFLFFLKFYVSGGWIPSFSYLLLLILLYCVQQNVYIKMFKYKYIR